MKAGILTFHRANNHGAVLQAAALRIYISNSICDCEIIDFFPNNSVPPKPRFLRKLAHYAVYTLRSGSTRKALIRERRFDAFRKQTYKLSAKRYYGDAEIVKDPPEYDVIISGSDQILNTELTGASKAFYLAFDTNAKKISYASSFGRSIIPESEESLIKNELSRFDRISVRENGGADIIDRIIGKRPVVVADPVLLLDREEWEGLKQTVPGLPEKYIFVYSMEDSTMLEAAAKELSEKTGLPLISIRGGGKSRLAFSRELEDCGPAEFLGCVSSAEYVVTNSFHGTVFAFIFGKKVLSAAHSKRNARIESLLFEAGMEGKQLRPGFENSVDDVIIDGKTAYSALNGLVKRSKEYLAEALDVTRDGADT